MPRSDRAPSLAMLRKEAIRVWDIAYVSERSNGLEAGNIEHPEAVLITGMSRAKGRRALLAALQSIPTKGGE